MFNRRTRIKDLLDWQPEGQEVAVMGWVRTFRNNQFIALNDGSTNSNLQVVLELGKYDDDLLKRITTSASVKIQGNLMESLGKGQRLELKAKEVEILGDCDAEKYPLQPKKHSLEFLREIAHLRFRTNTFGAVFRVRHSLAFAVHSFFNEKGFVYLHTPIITASDAEGAGEMFRVSTLPMENPPRKNNGSIDFSEDFFGRATNLTVSGQLEGELGATAFGDI
ncbi:MAG TPA: OB-fold nucleic acid binding domain-containing protein, partial [Flavobacterium sp.]|nr:OB-fold nucleic acid binding domain-containing protein [Flavobacterium sp.]